MELDRKAGAGTASRKFEPPSGSDVRFRADQAYNATVGSWPTVPLRPAGPRDRLESTLSERFGTLQSGPSRSRKRTFNQPSSSGSRTAKNEKPPRRRRSQLAGETTLSDWKFNSFSTYIHSALQRSPQILHSAAAIAPCNPCEYGSPLRLQDRLRAAFGSPSLWSRRRHAVRAASNARLRDR